MTAVNRSVARAVPVMSRSTSDFSVSSTRLPQVRILDCDDVTCGDRFEEQRQEIPSPGHNQHPPTGKQVESEDEIVATRKTQAAGSDDDRDWR